MWRPFELTRRFQEVLDQRHRTRDATEELKFDGYRALAIKTGGRLQLRSRNDKDFGARYPGILKALTPMPDETVIDGEVVALDPEGRPSFNLLQNYGSAGASLHFFVFDILILKGEDVMSEPLVKRRQLLEKHVLPKLDEPIRLLAHLRRQPQGSDPFRESAEIGGLDREAFATASMSPASVPARG
jgi:ATP-dependent DNA ligase